VKWTPQAVPSGVTVVPTNQPDSAQTGGQATFVLNDIAGVTSIEATLTRSSWRRRRLTIYELDLLQYESAKIRGSLVRNRHLIPPNDTHNKSLWEVSPSFVYRTQESAASDPLFPQIVVTRPVAVSQTAADLSHHLETMLTTLLTPSDGSAPDTHRLRLEVRYGYGARLGAGLEGRAWNQEIPVSSPQRLLPPVDVSIVAGATFVGTAEVPGMAIDRLIQVLTDDLATWQATYRPDLSGRLVFDLVIYSSLSPDQDQRDKPLLHLTQLQLPLSLIDHWH